MNASGKYQWLCQVILVGIVYLVVGVAFPNPPASNQMQFLWRLGAWLICAAAFAVHIGFEHFRHRSSPRITALYVSSSVALGAFGLAAAANIHALTAGTANQRLLAIALLIWPVITGAPAFVVALAAAAALARVRPNDKSIST
jgi:phosphoglycerol transferase MdoB-like AlkP superfamily enzyme